MSSAGVPIPFMGSGIKQDLHLLYNKFSSIDSNKIRDFAESFREMRFETIFHHRINPAEHIEFSEYLFQNASLYFGKENEIGEPRSFKERVFGIYVCYALYSLQPVDHVCQIPVTQVQFEDLLMFQKTLSTEKILEPLAALKSLLLKKAFRLKVFQSTYDPATHKKYLSEEEMPHFSRKPIDPFAHANSLKNHHILGELSYIHNSYMKSKIALGVGDIQVVGNVNPVDAIRQTLEMYQNDFEMNKGQDVQDHTASTVVESAGSSRSALRSKAYSAGLKHTRQRRYLDPNMEENFKHLTFGEIAQKCLEEHAAQTPRPIKQAKHKRKRKMIDVEEPEMDADAIAEEVLRNEYASRVKAEDMNEDSMLSAKIGKQGTSGVAKIRAPKRKNAKLVQIKRESVEIDEVATTSHNQVNIFNSPDKNKNDIPMETKPRISDTWIHRLNAWDGAVQATDKKLKNVKRQIKMEEIDDTTI